jgi:hypothetical protein
LVGSIPVRRRITALLIVGGLTAGAGLPVTTAAGAAGLRVRDHLTWTRPDGSRVAFRPDVRVWCGRWASDVPAPSIHVRVGARRVPRWELDAVVADVQRRPVVRLPHSFVFDHPTGAELFATDRRNELSSETERSRGRIRFLRVSCAPRLRIAFRLSGRVGSEFGDGEPLVVRGSFSASTS